MRHLFLSTVAIAALAGQAFAGDLPSRKDEPAYVAPAPVFNWTGIYIGADIGGAWGNGNLWVPGSAFGHNAASSSVIGGGFAGYNYQINNFVLGLQAELDSVSNGNYRYTSPVGYYGNVYQTNFNQSWTASVDGRLGYSVPSWDRFLIYAIGGVAWSEQSSSLANLDLGYYVASGSSTRTGYDVGGGLEYAFTNNWTGRLEYRYYNFGSNNTLWSDGVLNGTFYRTSLTDNVFRFGLAYKYGAPQPVVAKY